MLWVATLGVLAYPVLVNLGLALGVVQMAFEGTDQVKVDFARAWSLWPGRVHVEGLRLTMQDRNVQFSLDMASADVEVSLLDLVHKTFHATRVRGAGVVSRFRHRIQPESAGAPYVAALPPIPEFDDPPLLLADAPTAPLDEADYDLWTVHIDDVDVGVDEIWAQMFRYEGQARIQGAFRLRPAKRVWVGPGELTLMNGTLSTGPHEVLHDLAGGLSVTVDDFDTESAYGLDPFKFVFAHLRLQGQVPHLGAIDFLTSSSLPFRIEDGSGVVDLDVTVDRGRFTPASRVVYRTVHLGVKVPTKPKGSRIPPFHIDGELTLRARGIENGAGGRLEVELPRGAVRRAGTAHVLQLWGVTASAASTAVDVFEPWAFAGAQVRVGTAKLENLAWVHDLPLDAEGWALSRGRARASGSANVTANGVVDGSIDLALENARGSVAGFGWEGSADAAGTFATTGGGRGRVTGGLAVRPLKISNGKRTVSEISRVELVGALASLEGGGLQGQVRAKAGAWLAQFGTSRVNGSSAFGNVVFTPDEIAGPATAHDIRVSDIQAQAGGSCPFIRMKSAAATLRVQLREGVPSAADLTGALDDLSMRWGQLRAGARQVELSGSWNGASVDARVASKQIRLKNGAGAPKSWLASAEATSLRTTLNLAAGKVRGKVRLNARGIRGQVGEVHLAGNVNADLQLQSRDPEHRSGRVTGRIQARQVMLATEKRQTSDWWADFEIEDAHVDTRENFDVAGKVRATLRDGLPALHVLVSEDEIPGWIPDVFPLDGTVVHLGVARHCRWTDVRVLDATGGPLMAEGRVQFEPGQARGAILLRLAALEPVSAGFNFIGDYSNTSLFAGNTWLARKMLPLAKAATEKYGAVCAPETPTCE